MSVEKERFLSFWGEASDKYDEAVLSPAAPVEIKRYVDREDKILTDHLNTMLKTHQRVAFVEFGSGTGRYVTLRQKNGQESDTLVEEQLPESGMLGGRGFLPRDACTM